MRIVTSIRLTTYRSLCRIAQYSIDKKYDQSFVCVPFACDSTTAGARLLAVVFVLRNAHALVGMQPQALQTELNHSTLFQHGGQFIHADGALYSSWNLPAGTSSAKSLSPSRAAESDCKKNDNSRNNDRYKTRMCLQRRPRSNVALFIIDERAYIRDSKINCV
jgi:hypothetical protein